MNQWILKLSAPSPLDERTRIIFETEVGEEVFSDPDAALECLKQLQRRLDQGLEAEKKRGVAR